jgi:uncharacterized protein YggE
MSTTRLAVALPLVVAVVASGDSQRAFALAPAVAANTVSVVGEAEIRVVPDEVILSLGVETFDRALRTAKAANDERMRRVIAAARAHGVAADHIQTDYLAIEPRHRDSNVALELLGYVIRKTVVIRLREIGRFEDLLTDALDAGVTHVHTVEFRTTALRAHRDQARTLAMKAAREKADLLARESGHILGAVQAVGEASYGYWSSYGSWWGGRYGSAMQNVTQNVGGSALDRDATLAPGQISVRASVSTTFGLQ